jgi:C4-dicarboxylate-specific signal transduction histidine kinase
MWMVRLRWLAVAITLAGTAIGKLAGGVAVVRPLLVLAAVMAGYNGLILVAVRRRGERAAASPRGLWPAQIVPDLLTLSGLVYSSAYIGVGVGGFMVAMYASAHLTRAITGRLRVSEEEVIRQRDELHSIISEQRELEGSLRERNREMEAMTEALRRHRDEIAQREKMAAVGTMAAGVAHEVGNPLACLSAIVQLLQRRKCPEEERHLRTLQEQIARITKILRELLGFARPDTDQQVLVDLDAVVESTVKMVGYSHRSRHARIESVPRRNLPPVRIAPHQFQQVLINLILNALDAVRGMEGKPVVTIERGVEDGWVSVKVIDGGVGMNEQQVRQAFEPFYTTKPAGEGTGLGPAVSYRLVERLGGRIRIDSSPGAGSVATVSFPAAEADSLKAGAAGPGKAVTGP